MTATQISEKLISSGVRPTSQRVAVYKYLLGTHEHPRVADIYSVLKAENPTLSLGTVYNSVEVLCSTGLVRKLTISGSEARYDAFVEEHGHFLCEKCGKVFDFPLSGTLHNLPDGFTVTKRDVYCEGICDECK